jgi:hypothetical protein
VRRRIEQQLVGTLGGHESQDQRTELLGNPEPPSSVVRLPERHPQHSPVVVDVSRHPRRHFALPQPQVHHQQRPERWHITLLRPLHRDRFELPRLVDAKLRLALRLPSDG